MIVRYDSSPADIGIAVRLPDRWVIYWWSDEVDEAPVDEGLTQWVWFADHGVWCRRVRLFQLGPLGLWRLALATYWRLHWTTATRIHNLTT